jgi:hypothetical protein
LSASSPAGIFGTTTCTVSGSIPVRSASSQEVDMALFSRAFFRRRIISLATSLSVSATSFAFAEDPGHSHRLRTSVGDGNERQFLFASDLAISKVSRAMLTPPSGDVDRDFVAVMIPHDEATIDMARAELRYGHDGALRQLALSLLDRQQREISLMNETIGKALAAPRGQVPPAVSQSASVSEHKAGPQDELSIVNGNLAAQ